MKGAEGRWQDGTGQQEGGGPEEKKNEEKVMNLRRKKRKTKELEVEEAKEAEERYQDGTEGEITPRKELRTRSMRTKR